MDFVDLYLKQGFRYLKQGGEGKKIMAMEAFMVPSAADMICDDPFDSIDDLLDFPNDDDVLAVVEACGDGDGGAPLPLPQAPPLTSAGSSEGLHDATAAISGGFKQENDALGLCNDIDIANLEWLSNFFEDSELINFDFPATPAGDGASIKMPNNRDDDSLFRSSSPISVLEPNTLSGGATTTIGSEGAYSSSTTSSCSSSNYIRDHSISTRPPPAPIDMPIVPARARTKRPRRPSFSARSFVPPPSSEYPAAIPYPVRPAEPESVGESYGPVAMKKNKKKAVISDSGGENWVDGVAAAPPVRKCMHCEIQRTPQWRAGPMGPKTLCNACGVRYKSGRLFPEYRPAASPTFVPSFHSNSHKKVVEMRLNSNQTAASNVGMRPLEGTVAAKNCDLLKYLRGQDRDN